MSVLEERESLKDEAIINVFNTGSDVSFNVFEDSSLHCDATFSDP